MIIFFLLIAMGVVFLLYVLANFWRDGHLPKDLVQRAVVEPLGRKGAEVVVITHPISLSAQGGLSVIPFPVDRPELRREFVREAGASGPIELPVKRFSTR